jgi:putative peptidoglycan lipid II flippase
MMGKRIALTALTLFSSLTSFVAHTLLLKHQGASEALDLLFYAASMPTAFAGITSGVLLYLLPPRFTKVSFHVQKSTLCMFFSFFVVVFAIAVAIELTYSLLLERHMLGVLLIGFTTVALLTLFCTLASCIAEARGVFMPSSVASMITSFGLLSGVAVSIETGVVWWLLVGQLLGTASGMLWLFYSLGLTAAWRRLDVLQARVVVAQLWPHVVPITMGTMAFTLFQPIDAALCTQLASGSLSVMSYAQRVVVAVGTAVSLGAYVVAARTAQDRLSSGGQQALQRLANSEVFRVVVSGLVVWAIYKFIGHHLLWIALGSSTMKDDDLVRLIDCVQWMLLGVGPMAAIPYLFRVFYSMQYYRKPSLLGVCVAPVYGLLSLTLIPTFDILALAYAYAGVWWIALIVAMLWLNGNGPRAKRAPV